jgi:type II secretory pathway pseudopilin PulG
MGLLTTAGRRRASARGYTLVALMVGLTVMMILIAAVLPTASSQMQRSREDELIFRGSQYAEGIRVFRRRYGRYPNALRELIDARPRSIRKLWKDPMTPDGEWAVIGLVAPVQGIPPPGGPGGAGGSATPTPTPVPTASPFAGSGGRFGASPGGEVGPVTGVYSKSTKKGFRLFQGRENYNDWRFTEQTVSGSQGQGTSTTPGGLPGPGIGGGGPGSGGGGPVPK